MSDKELLPIEQMLPNNLFILPLTGNPVFPGLFTPLVISDANDVAIVNQAVNHGGNLGLLLVKSPEEDEYSPANLHTVGTVVKIIKKIKLPDGGINIFVSTLKRFVVKQFYPSGSYLVAEVEYQDDIEDKPEELRAWTRQLITEMKDLSRNNQLFSEEMRLNMVNIDHPGKLADFLTSILNIDRILQQNILETLNVRERIEKVLLVIKKEQKIAAMQQKIQNRVNQKIEKNQREYFLREELKNIQMELGITTDPRMEALRKIREKIAKLKMSPEIKESVESEFDRLQSLDSNSPDYAITRTYLEIIADLPWNEPKPDNISIENARKILEKDHYGMKDVKERILEYLAVRKLKNDPKGSIICLVGPPGVGKTSVAYSIARALKKKFFRFSVGGMRDEAEIKGHRRTYIGAMPGKIIQGLKQVKTRNPLFLIDEIDKMGVSFQGDPASALLEVLDPEQNTSFRDNYLDLPFDLSDILFVVTCNTLDTIPRPLLDRMEVIPLSGYTSEEKLAIGKKYLVPKSLKKHGLTQKDVKFPSSILRAIADEYAREAGVRNYEKQLDKINRKVAFELVSNPDWERTRVRHEDAQSTPERSEGVSQTSGDEEQSVQQENSQREPVLSENTSRTSDSIIQPITIDRQKLIEYLGQPIFREDELIAADRPGTSVGLAWTSMGGDTLLIESQNLPGKGELKLTGQLGSVMQESANIAYSWLKASSLRHGIDPSWYEKNSIHLHLPEGATPKDGPSAGITMTVALYSLVTGQVMAPHMAMTGELTLKGNVMPIGGLKEKILAARRNKIQTILFPKQNQRDLDKLDANIKTGITFHPVSDMEEVLALAFPHDKMPHLTEMEIKARIEGSEKKRAEEADKNSLKMSIAIAKAVTEALGRS
ncbi:endopeptidase La [Parasphaerochaeta coccoides]|uniref:Lon protease n=1 Tax=Parasphaerochaeta coccoides (strain ATCC BAA-1237 / DSM 17374 / SPN1) TaxID=760011 RepID=F4GHT1_PARC1|nr:endopeptidase La [Parasphaerochaeta coccoides]AEC01619.1 ATP dependent PIM1 peptidase [Parasphaerochaeta coccoides DSM 17374]